MSETNEHFSTFALDVAWAEGLERSPALARHVAGCARCRAYLDALDAAPAAPEMARPRSVWTRAAWAKAGGAAAALALAAALVLVVRGEGPDGARYVGEKGAPGVQVLLKRGTSTRVWDGREAVRPGDAVALHVACEGYKQVTVAAGGPPAAWRRAAEVSCPGTPSVLPFTLVVDQTPGAEHVAVVLSDAPLVGDDLDAAVARGPSRRDRTWSTTFTLPKQIEPSR